MEYKNVVRYNDYLIDYADRLSNFESKNIILTHVVLIVTTNKKYMISIPDRAVRTCEET